MDTTFHSALSIIENGPMNDNDKERYKDYLNRNTDKAPSIIDANNRFKNDPNNFNNFFKQMVQQDQSKQYHQQQQPQPTTSSSTTTTGGDFDNNQSQQFDKSQSQSQPTNDDYQQKKDYGNDDQKQSQPYQQQQQQQPQPQPQQPQQEQHQFNDPQQYDNFQQFGDNRQQSTNFKNQQYGDGQHTNRNIENDNYNKNNDQFEGTRNRGQQTSTDRNVNNNQNNNDYNDDVNNYNQQYSGGRGRSDQQRQRQYQQQKFDDGHQQQRNNQQQQYQRPDVRDDSHPNENNDEVNIFKNENDVNPMMSFDPFIDWMAVKYNLNLHSGWLKRKGDKSNRRVRSPFPPGDYELINAVPESKRIRVVFSSPINNYWDSDHRITINHSDSPDEIRRKIQSAFKFERRHFSLYQLIESGTHNKLHNLEYNELDENKTYELIIPWLSKFSKRKEDQIAAKDEKRGGDNSSGGNTSPNKENVTNKKNSGTHEKRDCLIN
ncbi:hypothetical protein ACTA71_002330 [Dictyostelium dimigraforme]